MKSLPKGWAEAELQELAGPDGLVTDGDWIESKDQDPAGDVRLIQLMDIGNGEFRDRSRRFLTLETARRLGCTFLEPGDVLIARMPDPIGRACVFPGVDQPAVTAVDVLVWRGGKFAADPNWLMKAINSPVIRGKILAEAGGTTRQRISGARLKAVTLPVPPLAEQKRIATTVESLTAKSAGARAELTKIDRLVTNYKGAVLEQTFVGNLTKDWRQARGIPDPSYVSLTDLCASITDGDHQAPPRAEAGIPFITISAMNDGRIRLEKASRFVPQIYFEGLKASKRPEIGDVLYSVTGSIGIPALVEIDAPFVFQRHIAILKPDHDKINSHFLAFLLAAPQVAKQGMAVATGTAQLTIPLSGLRSFKVPAPSLEEQNEIVRCIETAFAKIDRLAAQAKRALDLTNRLEEAILAKAFRGELVSQDPNDEPATTLLARIRAERDSAPKPRRGRTSTKRKDTAMTRNLLDVLAEAADWLPAQEAFRRCGITDGAETDAIEVLYAELRTLDKTGRLKVESVADEQGRKLYDRLKLLGT